MDDPKKIVWLASYPKSGNTWFRAFLTALLNPNITEIDINDLYQTTIASNRQLFDDVTGVSSSDLKQEEIERLRPLVYRMNAQESGEILYHKVHDAWTFTNDGNALFPADITKAVLYFIRNPLDVAVSFSHHLNTSIDRTIKIMNDPEYAFCQRNDLLHNQLRQRLLTWSGHVKSWVDDSHLPILVIRYEDMQTKPAETFSQATAFLGMNVKLKEIETALNLSSFNRLKQMEILKGFSEKNAASPIFFRSGIAGDWKNNLSGEQVENIIQLHREVMVRYGYL
jgi:hypothetical protein